jgi:hypothetical protein
VVTLEEVRAVAATLPRSYEAFVHGRVKFRVGQIVYLSEPDKFLLPRESDLRYNWAVVRLAAIEADEMRDLVVDAWAMVVPKSVAAEYAAR